MKVYSLVACLISLAGCTTSPITLDLSSLDNGETPTVTPTVHYADWVEVQPGVTFKQLVVQSGTASELFDIVRIDQTQATLAVAVNEIEPKTISSWADTLGASIVVNGSYFDEQYRILTRTIADGAELGKNLSGATGLARQTADDSWSITPWTGQTISSANAMQSYPMLITAGVAFSGGSSNTAQRSVLATAVDGTLYIIIAEYGVLSLEQLAEALQTELDLELQFALNLDGGTSTGLSVHSSTVQYSDDSLLVPSVLYILP